MQKVQLNLTELVVDTFAAGEHEPEARGTVQAHADALVAGTMIIDTCSHGIACVYTRGC
jgi:hypothetical protein